MNWEDYVTLNDREEFLKGEAAYTKAETELFGTTTDLKSKEMYRALVLSARLHYLAQWINEHE